MQIVTKKTFVLYFTFCYWAETGLGDGQILFPQRNYDFVFQCGYQRVRLTRHLLDSFGEFCNLLAGAKKKFGFNSFNVGTLCNK